MGLREVGEVEWIQICILIWQRILDQAMSILLGSAQIQSNLEGSDDREILRCDCGIPFWQALATAIS